MIFAAQKKKKIGKERNNISQRKKQKENIGTALTTVYSEAKLAALAPMAPTLFCAPALNFFVNIKKKIINMYCKSAQ